MRFRISLVASIAASLLTIGAQSPAVVPVPKSAEIENVPPVPQALADAIAPYASFRQAVLANWHPAARRMLVNTRRGDTFQAYTIDAPQAEPVQATFQPRSVGTWAPGAGSAWFAEGGRSVLFRQDENAVAHHGGPPTRVRGHIDEVMDGRKEE